MSICSYKVLFICFLFLAFANHSEAQLGKRYSESEIQYQHKFIDAKSKIISGKYQEGISLMKEVLKTDPKNDAAAFELARAYSVEEDFENSIYYIKKAINNNASNSLYQSFLVDQYEQSKDYESSIVLLEDMIIKDSNNHLLYEHLAYLNLQKGNPDKAIEALNQLENLIGINEGLTKRKFEIHKGRNDFDSAEAELKNLSSSDPQNTKYLHQLANFYKSAQEKKKEKATLEQILAIDPEDSKALFSIKTIESNQPISENEIASFLENDQLSLKEKILKLIPMVEVLDVTSSIEDKDNLNTASEILRNKYSKDPKAFAIAGDIAFNQNDFENSIKYYQQTLSLSNKVFSVWQQLMRAQVKTKRWEDLQETSENAINYFPNQTEAFLFHGLALNQLKDYKEAKSYLREAHMIAGKNIALHNDIRLVEADLDINEGNNDAAINKIETVLEEGGSNSGIHLEVIGDLYSKMEDSNQAQSYWRKAKEKGNMSPELSEKIKI